MKRIKLKLSGKLIIPLIIVGVIMTLVISFGSFFTTKNMVENQNFVNVKNVATVCADLLNGDEVKKYADNGGNELPSYAEMTEILNKFKKDNGLAFLILHVPTEATSTALYEARIDGDDPSNLREYMDVALYTDICGGDKELLGMYSQMYDNYKNVRQIDKPLITDDDYGYLYAAYAAVVDSNGVAVALIDASISMDSVRANLNMLFWSIILICLLVVTALIIVYIFLIRFIVLKPIHNLSVATKDFVSTENIKPISFSLKTGDELETLSESFNKMTEDIVNYIDNITSVTEEKERISTELNVATQIQASMLPCIFPAFPDRKEFDIYASMHPAKEVGGDFYDFFLIDENHLAVVVADVSGKGVPAALFMVIAKTLIKNHAQMGKSVSKVFTETNAQLCEGNEAGLFVTGWIGILEISSGKFSYCNAGHNPPLIKRKGASFEYVKQRAGFVLAGMEGIQYKEVETELNGGDMLFLYTDGVTEATNVNNELFGEPALLDALNACKTDNPKDILDGISNCITEFVKEELQFDDITMLCLKIRTDAKL